MEHTLQLTEKEFRALEIIVKNGLNELKFAPTMSKNELENELRSIREQIAKIQRQNA